MIEPETAAMLRLIGLLGFAVSVCLLALAERSSRAKLMVFLGACAGLLFALVYYLGVMAASESGAGGFLPRFP